ncbi:MAG: DcaP family trimeric outer membrane transporter [Halioglobus sp.]
MIDGIRKVLPLAIALALVSGTAMSASDSDRIRLLEEQLAKQQALMEQQQRSLKLMQDELQNLKHGAPLQETAVVAGSSSAPAAVAALPAQAQEKPGPGFDIYGFVMADAIYDFKRVDPDWNDTLRVTTIPTNEGQYGADGEFIFSVRQSRLGIKGDWDTSAGKVTALFEGELYGVGGDAGQTTPRLRHAWVTWNDFGMGQYWSNFMDADVFPNTVDYWGPTGMVFYRNKQARYTWHMGEDEFAIALEDPDTALSVGKFRDVCIGEEGNSCESTIGDEVKKWNDVPDLSVRYRDKTDWGHWQLAGIARKLGFERRDTGEKDYEFGWGINASTVINTTARDRLKLQVVYGEGIGNYLNDGGLDLAPSNDTLLGNSATAVPLLGVVAYYDHYWNDKWSSSIGWSTTILDTTDGQDGSEFEDGQIAQINLLHYPVEGVMIGGELIWGERNDIDGADGNDVRAQMSFKVNFPR